MPSKRMYQFYVDKDPTRTRYLMNKRTGKLQGRRKARKGEKADNLLNVRVKKPGDAEGQIYGFLPSGKKSFPSRGTSSRRGTVIRRRI